MDVLGLAGVDVLDLDVLFRALRCDLVQLGSERPIERFAVPTGRLPRDSWVNPVQPHLVAFGVVVDLVQSGVLADVGVVLSCNPVLCGLVNRTDPGYEL